MFRGINRRDLLRLGTASTVAASASALLPPLSAQAAVPAEITSILSVGRVPLPMGQVEAFDPKPTVLTYMPVLTTVPTPTNATYADVDAVNLKATFICPPSGQIRFKLTACATVPAQTAVRWLLRHNGKNVVGTETTLTFNTGAASTGATNYTARGIMKVDGDGVPLVPGRQYTVTWGHRCSVSGPYGYTQYGGSCGAATMALEPVIHRVTECDYPWAATRPGWVPLWLCKDGQTLLGLPGVGSRLAWSVDDGKTWNNHPQGIPVSVQQARDMDNGEVVVFSEAVSTKEQCAIWVSSGWAGDKSKATFKKVRQATAGSKKSWREFSVDTFGSIILAAEYGPKVSRTDMAGAVHMSEDYGQTWKVIFDLAAPDKSTGVGAHVHGVCYDPWWDAIWVTCGDGPGNRGVWVSFDRGATWRKTSLDHQCTSIIALPGCVLMFTDAGGPNAVYRIPRVHPDNLVPELAFIQDAQPRLTVYGTQAYQRRGLMGAPVLLATQPDLPGPGRLFATYDGYTFKEMWTDNQNSVGLMTAMGPSVSGKYFGRLNRVSYFAGDAHMLTINPPA